MEQQYQKKISKATQNINNAKKLLGVQPDFYPIATLKITKKGLKIDTIFFGMIDNDTILRHENSIISTIIKNLIGNYEQDFLEDIYKKIFEYCTCDEEFKRLNSKNAQDAYALLESRVKSTYILIDADIHNFCAVQEEKNQIKEILKINIQ